MMKKLLLLFIVFVVILGAVAHFTRPQDPRKSISELLQQKLKSDSNMPGVSALTDMALQRLTDGLQIDDHFFWVTVKKDNRVLCRGAFTQWFSTDELAMLKIGNDINTAKDKVVDEVGKAEDKVKSLDSNIKLPDVKIPSVKVPGAP